MTRRLSLKRWCLCDGRERSESPQPRPSQNVEKTNVPTDPRTTDETIVVHPQPEDSTLQHRENVNTSTPNLSDDSNIGRIPAPKQENVEDGPHTGSLLSLSSESHHSFENSTQYHRNALKSATFGLQSTIESGSHSRISTFVSRNQDKASELQAKLFAARIEWPEGGYRYFVPISVLRRSITFNSVSRELRRCGERFRDQAVRKDIADKIVSNAQKLFAILVYLGRSQFIYELLEDNVDDKDLPLLRSDKTPNFKLCSKLQPGEPITCLADWERPKIDEFAREQWSMMAPIFKHSEKVGHWVLDDNDVLPFIEDHEQSNQGPEYGGFGSVWEVKIHPAHHDLHTTTNTKISNPSFALKRLYSRGEIEFNTEVEMLQAFSKSRNPHLVKLLATFRYKGYYYLLFPYAKSNLRKYWEDNPQPDFSVDSVSWFLHQSKALACGLYKIHERETTADSFNQRAALQPALSENSSPGTEKSERLYGRHGDIKAENILWTFEDVGDEQNRLTPMGILQIADFGLMEFHTRLTRSLVFPANLRGSPTYEPPERRVGTPISRAYDIWSLGCVYLEFITWIVCGNEGLERFAPARGITVQEINDDTFYTIIDYGSTHSPMGVVRESVQEWIKDLHEKPRCSDCIHDFLTLISKDMLVIEPGLRIPCGKLVEKFCAMIKRASENSSYLTSGTPFVPRASRSDPTTPRTPSLSPVDGKSLPEYPSAPSKRQELLCGSPQIQPEVLSSLSPSSSPKLSMKEFGLP